GQAGAAGVGRGGHRGEEARGRGGGRAAGGPGVAGDAGPVVHGRPAEVPDDVLEAAAGEEVRHRAGVVPQVEGRVLVDRRAVHAALADGVRLQSQAGAVVEDVAAVGDPLPDDPHVVVGGQGDLVLLRVHGGGASGSS